MTLVYLDVDGVLADFIGQCERYFDRRLEDGKRADWYFYRAWGMTDASFWKEVENFGFSFWAEMPVLESGRAMLKVLNSFGRQIDVCLLTAVAPIPSAMAGRMSWVRRNFPQFVQRMIVCPTKLKTRLAAPGRVLIDDCQDTVENWKLLGGKALLWPGPANARFQEFWSPPDARPITYKELRKLLFDM